MSRCFPYPPPGYALSSARNALIDSIKLQKPRVQAEEQRKEKKRDKKEKKKDKRSLKNLGNSDFVPSHFGEKFWSDGKGDFSHKGSKAEIEQLERSGLTEEHAKPVFLPGPSSSSDSTENSNKRKRQPSPVDVSRGHGKIIRIRLTSKKQNQSDAPSVNEQKPCSTSSRIHAPCEINNDVSLRQRSASFCSTSGSTSQSLVLKTGGERIHVASNQNKTALPFESKVLPAASKQIKTASPLETKLLPATSKQIKNAFPFETKVLPAASKQIKNASPLETKVLPAASKQIKNASPLETKVLPAASKQIKNASPLETKVLPTKQIKNASPLEVKALPSANKVLTEMQIEGLRYQNLFENWVPPQMLDDVCVDNEDEDWLFGGKCKLGMSEKKRVHRDDSIPCTNMFSLWPRAQYLPEVDLFALPYTVPF